MQFNPLVEILALSIAIGLYLAPIAFISVRLGVSMGLAACLIWAIVGISTWTIYGASRITMTQESYQVLSDCSAWYNHSLGLAKMDREQYKEAMK